MRGEGLDFKQIMKLAGKELGEAFGTEKNTFLPNGGKVFTSQSVPDWSAIARESFGKKKKGKKSKDKKNKKSEAEVTAKCAEYAEEADEAEKLAEDTAKLQEKSQADIRADSRRLGSTPGTAGKQAGIRSAVNTSRKADLADIRAAARTADAARIREAVVWAEILGEPKAKRRQKKRMNG